MNDERTRVVADDPTSVDDAPAEAPSTRYDMGELLGVGGMGEVRQCADQAIGRVVARKAIRGVANATGASRARFIREARVQGQLEHPAVVPVYDLARDEQGDYFTMKRIRGLTLKEIIVGHRAGDTKIQAVHTRRRLLSAMMQVCQCIAYAHTRGVLHRDVKPSNVMLGDFGEVYVLDWGVARVEETASDTGITAGDRHKITRPGGMVGTLGYASPEQARAENETLTPRSDVYSLGVILFELLALQSMHPRDSPEAMLLSTLHSGGFRPSERRPVEVVPVELDDIVAKATALDPRDRYASARELHDAIERFLDGERDIEQRRKLAARHAERAERVLQTPGTSEDERAVALHELAQAVALDPGNSQTIGTILDLIGAPPTELPREAVVELARTERDARQRTARHFAIGQSVWFATALCTIVLGIRSWSLLCIMLSSIAATVILGLFAGGRTWGTWALVVGSFVPASLTYLYLGPFFFTSGLAGAQATGLCTALRARPGARIVILGLAVAAVFVPALLQWWRVLPQSYTFLPHAIIVNPQLVDFPPRMTQVILSLAVLAQMVIPTLIAGGGVDALLRAERASFTHLWRLRQMLPAGSASS
jgi:eukaryotic-like serine/threonine-protein kinase